MRGMGGEPSFRGRNRAEGTEGPQGAGNTDGIGDCFLAGFRGLGQGQMGSQEGTVPLTPGGPQEACPVGWEKSPGLDMVLPLTFGGLGQSGSRTERVWNSRL